MRIGREFLWSIMDVLDDVKLGKMVKQHGGTQDFIGAPALLSIRWYDSLWGVITGLEKNGFAALNYSLTSVLLCTLVFAVTMTLPYFPPLFLPLSGADAMAREPALYCTGALVSPSTGIIDSHGLMLAYQGEAEDHGAVIAFLRERSTTR